MMKRFKNTFHAIWQNKKTSYGLIFLFLFGGLQVFSQTEEPVPNWDNKIYIGNKVAGISGNWRFSGELQVRLEDNMGALDNWFVEGIATYILFEKIEIVPDFRISIKPDNEIEYRPGMGFIYKINKTNYQFVNQIKWQIGINNKGNLENGLRYAIFTNRKISKKIILNFAFGAFYRWEKDWNGFQFIRFGPGVAYLINKQHTINFNYLISAENDSQMWHWGGIPLIQLVINFNKGYKYTPAKYISF